MTGIDHEQTEQISIAARWLAEHWQAVPEPLTLTLRQQFGLDFGDAVKAIAEAKRLREVANG
jgi:hypothetical protein